MFFRRKPRPTYRSQQSNWVNPRLIGLTLLAVSVGLLLHTATLDESESTSFGIKVLHSPVTLANGVRNWVIGTYDGLMANLNARQELEETRAELEAAKRAITELRFQLQRHEAIRDALKLPQEAAYQTLPAIVLMRDLRFTGDLVINRGLGDGVERNMPVWTGDGLVGRTRTLNEHRALIQPITDPGSAVGVYVEDTPIAGILRGNEDGRTMLLTDQYKENILETNLEAAPGQRVFTSGAGMVFPRGLLAGTVSDVTTESGIVVEPAVDFRSVQSVLVYMDTTMRDELLSLLSGEER